MSDRLGGAVALYEVARMLALAAVLAGPVASSAEALTCCKCMRCCAASWGLSRPAVLLLAKRECTPDHMAWRRRAE
jgi:hypothetical protein